MRRSRSTNHRRWFQILFFLPLTLFAFEVGLAARPNVILCMADDLGWGDTGYNGHQVLQTPNLDAMARAGLQFNRFYAGAAVCSPTRGTCLTGRHASRFGIMTANQGHLRRGELSLAEVLGDKGYRSGHFGKWHLGTLSSDYSGKKGRNPKADYLTPKMVGFDTWFSTEFAVATWDPYDPANAHASSYDSRLLYWENGVNVADGLATGLTGCDSRIIMDKALPFIESAVADEVPFFTVIWFHAPHEPIIGGPEYLAMYPQETTNRQHYFAVVTALDEQIGRLRAKLRELNVAENTMLWFCSDNGPEGNPGAMNRRQGSAGEFRGRKRSLYEGGIRVPGILEWPAQVEAGRQTDYPAVTSDYFPTMMDVVGYDLPRDKRRPYDGLSLMTLIEKGGTQRPRAIAFAGLGMEALSGNQYKLVHNLSEKRQRSDNGKGDRSQWELYDLIDDPRETTNLIAKYPDIADEMKQELQRWLKSCHASGQGADYR